MCPIRCMAYSSASACSAKKLIHAWFAHMQCSTSLVRYVIVVNADVASPAAACSGPAWCTTWSEGTDLPPPVSVKPHLWLRFPGISSDEPHIPRGAEVPALFHAAQEYEHACDAPRSCS